MRYRRDYQETHDIDWFFRYQGRVYHAASNGGMLPDVVDSNNNRIIQEKLEGIVGVFQVSFADNLNIRYGYDADLSSFGEYASKGFISLDRTENDKEDKNSKQVYHIVAYPTNGENYNNNEVLRLMPELKEGDIVIE